MQGYFVAIAAMLTLGAAACGDSYVCTGAACGSVGGALHFTPANAVISSTAALTPAPITVTLESSGAAGIPFAITCGAGVAATPASGTVSGSATITLQAPAQAAVGTVVAACTATSPQDASAHGQLGVTLVTLADLGGGADGGSGPVGPTGGQVDHLYFAVVGDSRPANIDDTANYPTAVIGQIYRDVEAMSPRPQFVVGTGDYMYSNTGAYTARPQASLYMKARLGYSGTFFPAMGNHECDGYTADNCSLNQTQNFQAFMQTLLGPLGISQPYYAVPISAPDRSWSAKLLFIACNAWDATQQSWLAAALAQPTTFTILVRHEPAEANTGPCVNAVEGMMASSSYDLSLVGHTHEFKGAAGVKEIVVGNGGAPLSYGGFGFTTVERLSSGWQIKSYDATTALPVKTFAVP